MHRIYFNAQCTLQWPWTCPGIMIICLAAPTISIEPIDGLTACVCWIRAKSFYCMDWVWHSCVHKSVKLGRWSHNEILYLILFWLCPIWEHGRQCLLLLTLIKAQRHSTRNWLTSKHKTDVFQRSQTIICLCGASSHMPRSVRPSLSHKIPIQNIAQYGNCKVNFSCIIPTLQHSLIISRSQSGYHIIY